VDRRRYRLAESSASAAATGKKLEAFYEARSHVSKLRLRSRPCAVSSREILVRAAIRFPPPVPSGSGETGSRLAASDSGSTVVVGLTEAWPIHHRFEPDMEARQHPNRVTRNCSVVDNTRRGGGAAPCSTPENARPSRRASRDQPSIEGAIAPRRCEGARVEPARSRTRDTAGRAISGGEMHPALSLPLPATRRQRQ